MMREHDSSLGLSLTKHSTGRQSRLSSSDDAEGNRRPVEALWYATDQNDVARRQRRGRSSRRLEDVDIGGQRAHAEQPAARRLMVSRWRGMIAMVLGVFDGAHLAVADHVGMRHTIGRGGPMAES